MNRDRAASYRAVTIVMATVTAAAAVAMLASCQTYEVVTAAPVEFWTTAEDIIAAVVLDLWALVELFL